MKNLKVLAHRGLSSVAPENTILSFKKAIDINADGIEFDIQVTKDKKIVVIHDDKLDRTTNGCGFVKDYTYGELKLLDAGSWFSKAYTGEKIPSFIEVLDLIKDLDLIVHIELKDSFIEHKDMLKEVLDLINQYNLENRVVVSSFGHEVVKTFNKLGSNIETAILFEGILPNPIEYLKQIGAQSVHTNMNSLTPSLINILKENKIKVRCYTINDKEDFIYLAKLGVDGIFTDKADEMIKLKNNC